MTKIQEKFIKDATIYGNAIQEGNHKLANKCHSKLMSIYQLIKQQEKYGELKELIQNVDENVRLWAATFLFKYDEDLALKTLSELIKSPRIVGLTASTVIDVWKKGMLIL